MKITSVEAIPLATPVRKPLKMAVATITERTSVLCRVTTDDGVVGVGEGCIAPYFTGETHPSATHLIGNVFGPLLVGTDPFDITRANSTALKAAVHNASARSAIDIALHDIVGQALNVPLYTLFGGRVRDSVRTIWHLSNGDPHLDAEEARAARADGFTLFKVKVGTGGVADDIASVTSVRDAIGEDADILLDANQGFDVQGALAFCKRVESASPLALEQPVHHKDIIGMARVCAATSIPIIADEGVFSADDLLLYLQMKACDGAVLKLMKSAGIAEARKLAALAQASRVGLHFGGMGETTVASVAAVHLAVTLPELRYGTGINPHYLRDDVVEMPLQPVEGRLSPPESPGLGIEVSDEAIERLRAGESIVAS